jgi:hypothetical protein
VVVVAEARNKAINSTILGQKRLVNEYNEE